MIESEGSGAADAMERVIAWLGELGARWGLPADACRVHGWLYLTGRAVTEAELTAVVRLPLAETRSALAWLADHGIAEADEAGRWVTGGDPWELVMRALERRRDRELGPALELLRASRREAASNPQLADRIGRLLALATDVEAIDFAGPPALDAIAAPTDERWRTRRPSAWQRRRTGEEATVMNVAGGADKGAFKVNSLTGLDRASAVDGRVVWDGPRSLWNGLMLGGALVLGPVTFRLVRPADLPGDCRHYAVRRPFGGVSPQADSSQLRMPKVGRLDHDVAWHHGRDRRADLDDPPP